MIGECISVLEDIRLGNGEKRLAERQTKIISTDKLVLSGCFT